MLIFYWGCKMNRIKELRQNKNISQAKLGKIVKASNQAISAYESGDRNPKEATWQALADFFGVSVDWLKGYGYSWKELVNLLNDGYDESFTYQHSRDLDNKIMDAIAEKTGNQVMQSLANFQKEYGNIKKLINFYAKVTSSEIPENKSDRVKFFNDNFDFLIKSPEVQRLLHATHSYTETEAKETLLDALLNVMGAVYIASKFDKDKPSKKHQ